MNTGKGAGGMGFYTDDKPEEEEPEEEGILQIDLEDYYDLLMEQQEQM